MEIAACKKCVVVIFIIVEHSREVSSAKHQPTINSHIRSARESRFHDLTRAVPTLSFSLSINTFLFINLMVKQVVSILFQSLIRYS